MKGDLLKIVGRDLIKDSRRTWFAENASKTDTLLKRTVMIQI